MSRPCTMPEIAAAAAVAADADDENTTDSITIAWPMKKALRETQTLRAGCSKADPKIFAPPQTPFP